MLACRTCLSRYDLSPLFGDLSVVKFRSDQLFLATGVKILHNDGLPQTACRSCIKAISRALELRQLSSQVDRMLRSIFKHNADIKVEQNEFIVKDNNDITSTKNTVSNVINSSYINSDILASNHNISIRSNHYEYKKINVTKKSHQLNTDKSGKNIILDRKDNVKPKFKNGDDNKFTINMKFGDVRKATTNNKDVENDSSSDDMPLAEYEETVYTEQLNKNHGIKEENDKFTDINSPDNIDNVNINFESIFESNEAKSLSNINDGPDIRNKTHTAKSKEADSNNKNNRSIKLKVRNNIEDTSDFDAESGQLCNMRLEDYISSKDIDELFNDEDSFEEYYRIAPNRLTERRREDHSRSESQVNIVDKRKSWNNYLDQTKKRNNSIHLKEDISIAHASPINNYSPKNKYLDERKVKWTDKSITQLNEKRKKLLSLAMTPYNPKGPVQCKLCHKRLQSVANFKSHAKTHFEPEFTCELENCGKRFNSRNHMYYHQQRRHGREKRLGCEQCGFRAVDRLALRNHERAEHTGERPYVCNECGSAFRMRNNIIQHMTIHFGVRNVQCELCPALFTRRSQLWTHQNSVHFLTYTYHCYLCPETYKGLAPVKKHLLTIHGVPQDQQLKIQCVKTRKSDAI